MCILSHIFYIAKTLFPLYFLGLPRRVVLSLFLRSSSRLHSSFSLSPPNRRLILSVRTTQLLYLSFSLYSSSPSGLLSCPSRFSLLKRVSNPLAVDLQQQHRVHGLVLGQRRRGRDPPNGKKVYIKKFVPLQQTDRQTRDRWTDLRGTAWGGNFDFLFTAGPLPSIYSSSS